MMPSQSQPLANAKTNKFERYQSPIIKLNQGGITAKQGQGVSTIKVTSSAVNAMALVANSDLTQASTSASHLMQNAAPASASLQLQTKGSKQMSNFRYGPVRAVQ